MPSTRGRILQHLKRWPGAGVEPLAQSLGLAPMTIRQHLAKLIATGLLRVETKRRPTGRPANAYYLTPDAEDRFPKSYDRLAGLLLEATASIDPHSLLGVTAQERRLRLFRTAARRAAAPHLPALRPLAGRERAQAAVALMREESGFTELHQAHDVDEIHEYNCVYERVAQADHDVCSFHTAYVGELLGAEVALTSSQCDGDTVCCFRPLSGPALAAPG